MRILFYLLILGWALVGCTKSRHTMEAGQLDSPTGIVVVKSGIKNNQLSGNWKKALASRASQSYIDSLSGIVRPLTTEEQKWVELIGSKTQAWHAFRDSLQVPFGDTQLRDTVVVLLGYLGSDDGFTYQHQTICLDVTALNKAYGSAKDAVNNTRIDRIFAHEYTHLLHKK